MKVGYNIQWIDIKASGMFSSLRMSYIFQADVQVGRVDQQSDRPDGRREKYVCKYRKNERTRY